MPLLRSFGRRINGLYWDFIYMLRNIPKWIRFKYQIKKLGVSEKYIREAFSYLAQLDLKDFVPAGRVFLFGAGNLVHVKHYTSYVEASEVQRIYEFTVTDNERALLS